MPLNSPVVLLVDDHSDSVEMYTVGLRTLGFRPVSATNAEDAFTRACECRPDVVVADMTLPGASGLDLTRQLREDARTKDAGIIVLSGHAIGSALHEASLAGCDRFLVKPCLPDVLALEIHEVLVSRQWSV